MGSGYVTGKMGSGYVTGEIGSRCVALVEVGVARDVGSGYVAWRRRSGVGFRPRRQ